MAELVPEREAVKRRLAERDVDVFLYEKDAGAAPIPHRETYLAEAVSVDL